MYNVFKGYLNASTWASSHPTDDGRFYDALAGVVQDPLFSADEMGEYFRDTKKVDPDDPSQQAFNLAIDERVVQAHAIRDFLDHHSIIV